MKPTHRDSQSSSEKLIWRKEGIPSPLDCVKYGVLVYALAVFFACPNFPQQLDPSFYWDGYLEKYANPLWDPAEKYEPGTHPGKLAFRLTVPAIAFLFKLNPLGMLIVQHLLAIALFSLLIWRFRHAKIVAFYSTMVFAFSGGGASMLAVPFYDGWAIWFIVAAITARSPALIFLLVTLASWTDERGFVASGIVLFSHSIFWEDNKESVKKVIMAIAFSWLLYLLSRTILGATLGWKTPTEGASFADVMIDKNMFQIVLWSSLKGGWAAVAFCFYHMMRARMMLRLAIGVGMVAIIFAISMSVADHSRSMSYASPLAVSALLYINGLAKMDLRKRESMRNFVGCCALVSLLAGTYYIAGQRVWWITPLPARIIEWWF